MNQLVQTLVNYTLPPFIRYFAIGHCSCTPFRSISEALRWGTQSTQFKSAVGAYKFQVCAAIVFVVTLNAYFHLKHLISCCIFTIRMFTQEDWLKSRPKYNREYGLSFESACLQMTINAACKKITY